MSLVDFMILHSLSELAAGGVANVKSTPLAPKDDLSPSLDLGADGSCYDLSERPGSTIGTCAEELTTRGAPSG